MAVPKYHEFMKPMLEILADGREHKLRDLYAERTQTFRLTEADRAEYLPSGKQLSENPLKIRKNTFAIGYMYLSYPTFAQIT